MQRGGKALLVCCLALGFAQAQENDEPENQETYGDEDGPDDQGEKPKISEEQMKAVFKKLDSKGAGKVPVAQIHAFHVEMRIHHTTNRDPEENYFKSVDQDGDGIVTLEEVIMPIREDEKMDEAMKDFWLHETAKFKAADKDNNGHLDRGEFAAFEWPEIDEAVEEAWTRAIFDSKDKNQDGSLSREEWHPHSEEEMEFPHEDFKTLDKNGDGKLVPEETKAWDVGKHWVEESLKFVAEHADANKDGFVTEAEFVAARQGLEAHEDAGFYIEDWASQLEL